MSALVRVHVEAIAGGPALGSLDHEQMRDLGERVIRFFQLDTSRLFENRIAQLLEARGDR